jgi:hypothetical protein
VTGTVLGENGTVPVGTVTVTVRGTGVTGSGAVQTDGSFAVDLAVGSLPTGGYFLDSTYGGDINFLASVGQSSLTIVYGILNNTNLGHPVHSGATLPIKLDLIDDAGQNVGSPDVSVTALYLTGPNGQQYAANWPGNANPNGVFKYDPGTRQYQFNLKTTGLPAGMYTFYFKVGNDPTLHSFDFEVD